MDESLMEIREYDGAGYRPLIDYGAWRVAILRWDQSMLPEKLEYMERHTQTDEVFVLLKGQASLILGGNHPKVESVIQRELETGKLYNVKLSTWHTSVLSRDATILIVENQDTGQENTEFCKLTAEIKQLILSMSNGVLGAI
jgi:ureidoglycolate hydrolase